MLSFWINTIAADILPAVFEQIGVPATPKKTSGDSKQFVVLADQRLIESNGERFQQIAEYVKKCRPT